LDERPTGKIQAPNDRQDFGAANSFWLIDSLPLPTPEQVFSAPQKRPCIRSPGLG